MRRHPWFTAGAVLWLALVVPWLAGELIEPPAAPTNMLTVVVMDGGHVISTPDGIRCGIFCDAEIEVGAQVTLYGGTDLGSSFAGWTGRCEGQGDTCRFTMDAPVSVGFLVDTIP